MKASSGSATRNGACLLGWDVPAKWTRSKKTLKLPFWQPITRRTGGKPMKIAIFAALVGFSAGICVTVARADLDPKSTSSEPLTGDVAALIADHFDRRIDRLEKGLDAINGNITRQLDSIGDDAHRCAQR